MPYLSDSSEWKIQLSKDLNLEYQPVPDEPIVKAFKSLAKTDERNFSEETLSFMTLRLLSIKIKPGLMNTFREIYKNEIIPKLQTVKGCKYAYLTENLEDENQALSLTIWESKQDADNYDKGGLFKQLLVL